MPGLCRTRRSASSLPVATPVGRGRWKGGRHGGGRGGGFIARHTTDRGGGVREFRALCLVPGFRRTGLPANFQESHVNNPRPATSALLLHQLQSAARGPDGRRTPRTDEPLGPGADGGLHVRVELRGARRPAPQPQPWGEGGERVVKKRAVATALIGYERPHFHHLLYHSIAPSISSQEHAQHCHQNEAA